ncbi:hypothetical protein HYS91_02610 [Candidatus Daviesbacteria bacterium]|nr:hypothetical protein [Candidatus Daviesbacteria bacterium]
MTHIPITLLAYLLNGLAVIGGKFLISTTLPRPLTYVFYFSAFSLVALILLPFTLVPSLEAFVLASTSTLLWTSGAYFMFQALKLGQASRVVPIIGVLIPTFLLFDATISLSILPNEIYAVVLFILGLFFLTLSNLKGDFQKNELIFEVLSAFFFAISYLVLREAYLRADYLSVLVYSRFILIPVAIVILLIPSWRRVILFSSGAISLVKIRSKIGILFLLTQAAGGASELLLTFAISLANPALVNSLQGAQYIFIFVISLVLGRFYPSIFKESYSFASLSGKIFGIILVGAGLYILAF